MTISEPQQMTESTTETNRTLITDFAEIFYCQKNVREAFTKYITEDYIQHNPNVGDGREAAIEMLEPKFQNAASNFSIKRILVDGDMAIIHLHGIVMPNSPGVAVVDMYRIENQKIVEHWDVVQPIPTNSVNHHPMF